MEAVIIVLEDRRAELAQRMETVLQAGAAASLASAGLAGLPAPDPEGTLLAVAELVAAALLLGAIARELRSTFRHGHGERETAASPGIGWVNLFAAAALFAEAYHRVYAGGSFPRPTFLMGVVALLLALGNPWIARRRAAMRRLRMDEAGIELRTSRLRGFRLAWDDLAAVEREGDVLVLRTRSGGDRRIGLRRFRNGEAVADALLRAAAAHAIPGAAAESAAPPLRPV
jgi:hypothetical protein